MKKTLAFLASLALLTGCSTAHEQKSTQPASAAETASIELSAESNEILAGQKTRIDVQISPSGKTLDAGDYQTSGGTIEPADGYAMFYADKPGTYEIFAEDDGIKSNTVSIRVEAEPESESPTGSDRSPADSSDSKSAKSDSEKGDSAADSHGPVSTTLNELLKNPEKYLNQTVDLILMVPQDIPEDKAAVLPDGISLPVLESEDLTQRIPVLNYSAFSNWGVRNEVQGVFQKQPTGNYQYVIDVKKVIPQSVASSAMPFGGTYVGASVTDMPKSGTFTFSSDAVSIRKGDQGLEGEKTGYVYNAGMSVRYDKVYQKDGYTWISYIAKSGQRCSAAVGSSEKLQYGFVSAQ